jgi:hypothetical protein
MLVATTGRSRGARVGRRRKGRYESSRLRVVVRSSGGGVLSDDSKEGRSIRGLASGAVVPDRRDTLRGVGDSSDAEDTGGVETPATLEDRRLRQKEFTVPPQIWKRPPSGWFARFARTEGQHSGPNDALTNEQAQKRDDEAAPTHEQEVETAAVKATLAGSHPQRRVPAMLAVLLFAAVVLAIVWRVLGPRRPESEPTKPTAAERGLSTAATATTSEPALQPSPTEIPSPTPAPATSQASPRASITSAPPPRAPASTQSPSKPRPGETPAKTSTPLAPAPSNTLGPIY